MAGTDLQPSFIERARERFRKEGLESQFAVMDMRKLDFEDEFDAIYNWQGSFGFFSESENLKVLQPYAIALREGGRLLIDQINRESLLRCFIASRSSGNLTIKTRRNRKTQGAEPDSIIKDGNSEKHNRMSIRLYTPLQMRRLFEATGFAIKAPCGSVEGDPYGRSRKRLIGVGRKRALRQRELT